MTTKQGTDFGDDFLSEPIKETIDNPPVDEPKGKLGRPAKATLVDDEPPTEPKKDPEPKPKDPVEPEPEPTPVPEKEITGNNDEDGLILSLAGKLGYEFAEDEEYEDSEEGLISFIEKQKEIGAQEIVTNYFNNVHPKAGELFDLVSMISDLPGEDQEEIISEFFKGKSPEIDFKSIDLKDENVQKSVLRTFFRNNGYSEEQITKKIDKFEIAGLLEDEAEEASVLLAKAQEKEIAEVMRREKALADKRKDDSRRYYESLKQTVDTGKVGNFTIPVSERKSTFDYIATGEALTKLNELWSTTEGRVQLSLMLKNNFKLDKYIDQAAATKNTSKLRERLIAGNGKLKSSDPRDNSNNTDWDDGQVQFAKK